MSKIALFTAIFLMGEMVAYFVFLLVKKRFEKKWQWRIDLQMIKGWLERSFLFLCLVYNLPHALIAFGAIKIGTRVNDKDDMGGIDNIDSTDITGNKGNMRNKVSNDYFFVGNMVSLLLVILYYALWLHWQN
ncbi:MAG: hypothetical protein E4H23_10955 [Chrysiogenales bacterium]|nr:MAG: hypothetical protein E4H23_10955 [Chrysiogenales bacterium]